MSLPSLQLRPISTSHYYTSGDVTIEAGVAIAPGVLFQADPDSRILIRTGACIGIGAILHAQNGTLEIGAGANIGAEVLLIGIVKVGANACIGSASTILNCSVESGQIIPAASLIGDTSRQPNPELTATDTVFYPPPESAQPAPSAPTTAATAAHSQADQNGDSHSKPDPPSSSPKINVYGQVYVNQMLVKMFPHRPGSHSPSADFSSSLPPQDP